MSCLTLYIYLFFPPTFGKLGEHPLFAIVKTLKVVKKININKYLFPYVDNIFIEILLRMNKHPLMHHERWMVNAREIPFLFILIM